MEEEERSTPEEGAVTPERFQSAKAALQRVLDGSTCLDDWTYAFSQVFNLTGRAVNSQRAPNPALLDACREYDEMLRKWYQQLPSLQGWLIAERTRQESRLAHGSRLRAWLRLHGQTR